MSAEMTAEERARALVEAGPKVAGGPWFVRLKRLVDPEIYIGPYENPAIARDDAERIRGFVAAVIRDARAQPGHNLGE